MHHPVLGYYFDKVDHSYLVRSLKTRVNNIELNKDYFLKNNIDN